MIQDISKTLSWLEKHPQVLKGIRRGIERETLRVTFDGNLALTKHPKCFGSALTHSWITLDFSESLLEFVTPIDDNVNHLLNFLRDIHRYVARHLNKERMWPLSIPCFINSENDIQIAQFGSSHLGRVKTLYREGLKNRYGALMQTISGVHYNFSLPFSFWKAWADEKNIKIEKETISTGYFHLIRNYYRFGWIIPYFFGASPTISSLFLKKHQTNLKFERTKQGMYYLPYATSLRLSNFGYTNKIKNNLDITFNNLNSYVQCLKKMLITPSEEFIKIGIKKHDHNLQLNHNILQTENELYTFIRPKCTIKNQESLLDALLNRGVEYVEIRSLDINPFSPIGISETQVCFLDLFLTWCILIESPQMSKNELQHAKKNWNSILLEGRKPGQIIDIQLNNHYVFLDKIGEIIFKDLYRIAKILDNVTSSNMYHYTCNQLIPMFYNPELTFSAKILKMIKKESDNSTGLKLSEKYHNILIKEPLEILNEDDFIKEKYNSLKYQNYLEKK
ncbi:Glutamate--cysteine ligase [Candidatus Ecksteinia adelgidicola]|nr:Glutamate--cysteine ligase [Candidatus Ecksteinia adelgidicola]